VARVIGRIDFSGGLRIDADKLRTALRERVGRAPKPSSLPDMRKVILDVYRSEGYLRATVTEQVEGPDETGRMAVRFAIDPGPRARVANIAVEGLPQADRAQLLRDLRVAVGQPFDATGVLQRADRWVERQRQKGRYEATLRVEAEPRPDLDSVDVRLDASLGPVVELSFSGDPLPSDKQRDLVPIQREGSADEDLLEDAKRRIEDYLHSEGYWQATADYARTERDGRLDVDFTVERGVQYFVADVELVGVQQFPRTQVEPLLRTRVSSPFVRATLDEDVAALRQFYRVSGFSEVKVTPSVVQAGGASTNGVGQVRVRITVEEGPRTLVSDLRFSGRREVPESELRGLVKLTAGSPFYFPQVAADREALRRAYENRGFRDVSVGDTVERSDGAVKITYQISEGPQAMVDHVIVVGNSRTGIDTITRALQLTPGEPVGLDDLAEAQRRLAELGLFRRVRVEDRAVPGQAARDVVVTVDEAPVTNIGYGGGLEVGQVLVHEDGPDGPAVERIEVAPRAFFEIGRRNLWGKNRSVNLFARVSLRRASEDASTSDLGSFGFNEYRLVGTYREPLVFDWPHTDLIVSGFLEQAIRPSFSFRARGVNTDLTRHVPGPYTLVGRYTFGHTTTFDEQYAPIDQPLIDRLYPQVRLSIVSGIVARDTRNDALAPERGTFLTADAALAARALGSEVGYLKTLGQAFWYKRLPTPGLVVLATGVRVGLANGFSRVVFTVGPSGEPIETTVDDLPAALRFYTGGATTVRGFAQDRLGAPGTIDINGFPRGGNGLVVLNGELRFHVWGAIGAAAFVDSGNVWLRVSDIDLAQLRTTLGFGLRYRSPIGPLRVDIGFKTDRFRLGNGSLERPYVIHINLGEAF
jgi:outer membrane protein assembly complex protein YaeT